MYVCVCNAVTERQIRAAAREGATGLRDLSAQLGVASCCGCCAKLASEVLEQALEEHQAAAYAKQAEPLHSLA